MKLYGAKHLWASLWLILFGLSVLTASGAEEPLLRVGCVTDTHIGNTEDSCQNLRRAFTLFQQHKIDLLVHVGDIGDHHNKTGYEIARRYFNEIFADRKPKELWTYAFHDSLYPKKEDRKGWEKKLKAELQVPNEPYDKLVLKDYPFLVFPQAIDGTRQETMIAQAVKDFPGKPVFVIDHVPPAYTTEGSGVWGGDVRRRKMLDKYPQVIDLSGHTHNSLRNERCIWQGDFTSVNCGCLAKWRGGLISNAGEIKKSDDVMIMEIFPDKIYFRCYALADGSEIRPDRPWCIPWPFDPATAPYNPQLKAKISPVPVFAPDAAVTLAADRTPFRKLTFTFPEASHPEKCYRYALTLSRKNAAGQWDVVNFGDCFGTFYLPQAPGKIGVDFNAGFFEANAQYRLAVVPLNYYGGAGKALAMEFPSPQPERGEVLYESREPMKDCTLTLKSKVGAKEAVPAKNEGDFYLFPGKTAQLNLPEKIWENGTSFRVIADLALDQPEHFITYIAAYRQPALNVMSPAIRLPLQSSRQRVVLNFHKKSATDTFCLQVNGGSWLPKQIGKIAFRYIRVEKLPR